MTLAEVTQAKQSLETEGTYASNEAVQAPLAPLAQGWLG